MENNEQCMNLQFQFLIMKYFEDEDVCHSTDELSFLMAPNMKNIGLTESDGEKFSAVLDAIIELLINDYAALQKVDGEYKKGLTEDYDYHMFDVVNGIATAFQIEIDKNDFLFTEAYEKLDAAVADKRCIFTEKDKSDFIRLYNYHINNYKEYDSPLTTEAQLEYLVARVFQNKKVGSRVTTEEIYKALEPNFQRWIAKDRTRTEADFHALIDGSLETLSNVNLQVNVVESVKVRYGKETRLEKPEKKKDDKEEGTPKGPQKEQEALLNKQLENITKNLSFTEHPFSFQDTIKWSPALKVWRSQDSLSDYWTYIVSLMEDQLEINRDEDDGSYGFTPFSWENILTSEDIFDIIDNSELVESSFNVDQLYRIGANIVKNIELYAVRVKDYETSIERIYLYEKNGHDVKKLSFSFMLSKQNDALQLKDIGAGIDSSNLAKLLKEIKDNYEQIPLQYMCQKLGWNGNAFVGAEMVGKQKYFLCRETNSLKVSSPAESSLRVWTDLCSKVIKDNVYGQIILATSFASALVEPLGKTTILMNLCGKSSIGKSTYEALATSVWSKPDDPRIHFSFSGTELGIIANLNDNFGVCVVIDDTSKSKLSDFTDFIYEVENSQSRARLGKDHQPEPVSYWKTSVLLSSEISILGGCNKDKEGVLRRLFEFHLQQGDLTKDAQQANEIESVVKDHYGVSGLAFVRFILDNGLQNDLEDMYAEQLEITRQKAGENGVEQGMAERSALILLAAQIANDALNLGFDLEAISDCLDQTVKEAVRKFEGNHRDFSREELQEIFNEILPDIQDKAIKIDDNYYHVLVDDFSDIEKNHEKEKNELRDLFNRYELTMTNKSGKDATHSITIDSHTKRVISIVKVVD